MSTPETPPSRPIDATGEQGGTALATTALILGIVTMVLALVPVLNLFAVFLGIAALVIGLIAVNRARSRGKGKALTGAILGGVGAILSIVLAVVYTVAGISWLVSSVERAEVTAVAPLSPRPIPESLVPTPAPSPSDTLERVVWSSRDSDTAAIDLRGGPGLVAFDCSECTGPVSLTTDGASATLVEAEGPWSGRYLLDADGASETTELTVEAEGDWTVIISDPSTTAGIGTDLAAGEGDDVVLLTAEFAAADISHDGAGRFLVVSYASGSAETVVEATGTFYDEVPLTGPGFVQVFADGPWAIVAVDAQD